MATKTPNPSATAARSRRSMPPPPTPAAALSPPFSAAPLRPRLGAAAVAGGGAPDEKPCVTLWEWWLERVEGEERKLAVSGYTRKNDAFTSAPIAKRYEPLILEDEDGVVVLIDGSMSLPRMRESGFSSQICEKFMIGFPYWWENWDSHMETYPECFIHQRDDSIQFYLQKFQLGNFLENLGPPFIENLLSDAKKNQFNDADTFPECSRFEEHTCGDDTSTKENYAESNDDRPTPVNNEEDNVETYLIESSPSQQKDNVDNHCNSSFGPTETCSSDETCKEAGIQNDTMHPDARIPSQQKDNVDNHCNSSFAPTERCIRDETCKETGNQNDTMHPDARSPSQQKDNVDNHCNSSFGPTETCSNDETCKETGNQNDTMHPDARELEAGSHLVNSSLILSTSPDYIPSDLEDGKTSAENSEDMGSKCLLAAVPPENANFCSDIAGYQSTPVASLKKQVYLERTELTPSSQEAVPQLDTSTPVHSDAQSLEQTVGPAEKRRSAQKLLRTPTMSPRIRNSSLYAHHAPLTRARAHSLSISTPESLKMKRTKSGRVVVPPLDPGSERIVYNIDGMISGVSPVLQSPLKGSPARKRKRKAL